MQLDESMTMCSGYVIPLTKPFYVNVDGMTENAWYLEGKKSKGEKG